MSCIRDIKCDFCNRQVKQKFNGEHFLLPDSWRVLVNEDQAGVKEEHICEFCIRTIRQLERSADVL